MERLNLRAPLAQHLEERLGAASREDRVATAERLGRLYVELLISAQAPAERTEWEGRARALLSQVPEADSLDLRTALARAVYARAEEIAERHRLRLASPEEVADAEATFRSLAEQFADIGAKAHRRVEGLERIEQTGEATEKLVAELGEARRQRSTAFYFAGWSDVYLAWLTRAEGPASEAMRHFGWLLNASGGRQPALDRVQPAMFQYEHVARAAVGVALAASSRSNDTEAIRWLAAVEESDSTPQAVRDQLVSRRFVVLAQARRWTDLEMLVRRLRRADRAGGGRDLTPLPTPLARLLAVLALDADRRTSGPQIEALARTALGDLVARKEAAQVLDLVGRYGTAPLGDTGFIVHYVRALQTYDAARKAHEAAGDADEPTADPAIATDYGNAAAMFRSALDQPDAREFKAEASRAAVMRGRSLLLSGRAREAGEALLKAFDDLGGGPAAEEPLWLAILALDRAARSPGAAGSSDARPQLERAIALFLRTYPESERAPRLVLMQVSLGSLDDDEALKVLSAVAKDSTMYDASRRQVARILYGRFRAARGADRDFAAARFAAAAEEVLAADRRAAGEARGAEARDAAERVVVRARQLLDALLTTSSPDVSRAEAVMRILQAVSVQASYDLGPVAAELAYRELQIALAKDDEAGAEAAMARLGAMADAPGPAGAGGPSQFQAAAERALYRRYATRLAAASGPASAEAGGPAASGGTARDEAAVADLEPKVTLHGARVIDRLGPATTALKDPGALSTYAAVAGAAMGVFRRTGDPKARDLALRLDGAILGVAPRTEASLRRVAEASEHKGDHAAAASAWRTILEARPVGQPAWFEARYESIRLIARLDPAKARAAMDEHRAVYPEFGPEPWGDRLRQLDREIPAAAPAVPVPATPGGAPP